MSTTSQTPLRILPVAPRSAAAEFDSNNLVEQCGGDRLEAWRIALRRSLDDPKLAEHWLEVADATVEHKTLPIPMGVAGLLVRLIDQVDIGEPILGQLLSLVREPRVRMWVQAVRGHLRRSGL